MTRPILHINAIPEDEQIATMGQMAADGRTVGFFVDDDAKADRYLEKLQAGYAVRVISRGPWPGGIVFCRIGPRLN